MGYLFDNYPFGTKAVECPVLYPYGMEVEWEARDKFVAPNLVDLIGLAIKKAIPDVEEWQWSVIKGNRIIFRFRDIARRMDGYNGLATVGLEVAIRRIIFWNPPDLPNG